MDAMVDRFDAAEPDEEAAPREIDIDLDPVITVDRKPFERLHLKEPTALQVQKAEYELVPGANPFTLRKYQIVLVSQVAGVPKEVVERMRITQLGEAWKFVEPFTPLFRLTGETLWRTLPVGGDGDRMTPGV